MLKKYVSLTLVALLLNLALYSTTTASTVKDDKFAERVKINVAKLGTGKDVKVVVKLKDGTKLKGYVSEIKDSGFVVVNEKTKTDIEVLFSEVKQVKGQNHSNGKKIFLRTAIIIGALLLYGFYFSRSSDY